MSEGPQYAAVAKVPLIKSPSLTVPRIITLPPDIHPLPDSVAAYFVYPFTLEPHVVTLESSRQATLTAHAARREAYLRARDDEKVKRKRDALRKVAPGFEPLAGTLVPTKVSKPASKDEQPPSSQPARVRSVMDDLVDQLAALDATVSSASASKS